MEAVTVKQLSIWKGTWLQLKRETWVLLTSIFHPFYPSRDYYFLQYQAKTWSLKVFTEKKNSWKKISILLNMIHLFMWAIPRWVRLCKGNSPRHGNTLSFWRLRSLNKKQKVTCDRKTFCKGSWLTGGNYWLPERPEEALKVREVLPRGILNKELPFLFCDMVTLLF